MSLKPNSKAIFEKKLHLKDNEDLARRIEAIKNNADVEYYDEVRTILPSVI